ncbi:hypothetical protein [Veronia pacifica]|uniref:Phage antitermination protein Q n=1 Tax=Veronia pacifica TaxID=1080227 RepID=A0A1C3EAD2_9GAMM|nr:hypothetical protein [Veronia pacifica]ODA30217.1 hypothetical protein A8L45_20645 [Veronia pacifica]
MNAQWDAVFEQWARWVHHGRMLPGGQSVLGKLIECQGVFGTRGRPGAPVDCMEAAVEASLAKLAKSNQQAATVFRHEYGALSSPGADTQLKRAHAISVSLPTYKRRLKLAREHVITELNSATSGDQKRKV